MKELTHAQLQTVALIGYASTQAMQALMMSLIRTHPDPAGLRAAIGEDMAKMRAQIAMSKVQLGENAAEAAEHFENHAKRWLAFAESTLSG